MVVDDQVLVRTGFRLILESEPGISVVGEAADGGRAVELALELRPDVVVMDIRMPEVDGIEATRQILARNQEIRVLVLTTFDLDQYVYEALKSGASGFLLKDASPEQLIAAVRTVASGESLLAPSITKRLIEHFVHQPAAVTPSVDVLHQLTPREMDVLERVGKGRTNTEIAQELLVTPATVKTHIAHIFDKLEVRDRAQAVVIAYESGVVQPGRTAGARAEHI
ncbi:MAG: response regulator transcription factor [bacterium]